MSVNEVLINFEKEINRLLESGDNCKAKDALQKISCGLYSVEAVILIKDGDLDNAEEVLLNGLKKFNKEFDLFYNLAYLYQLTGRYDEAVEFYLKAKDLVDESDVVLEINAIIKEIVGNHRNEPLVSVCMPIYNDEKHIIKAIQSVLNQTYQNFEIIVCDNNSSDKTYDLVKSIKDPRIRLYKNKENTGFLLNSNKAWKLAKGKYIVTLHGDDAYNETYIENVVRIFKDHIKVGIIHFIQTELKQNYFEGLTYYKSDKYYSKIFGSLLIPPPTQTAFRKEALIKSNYYHTDYWTAEQRLMMNIAQQGYDAYIEGLYLFERYNGPEKDSSQIDKFVLRFEHLYRFYEEFKEDKKIKSKDLDSFKKKLVESLILLFQNKDKNPEIRKAFINNKDLIKSNFELLSNFIDYILP